MMVICLIITVWPSGNIVSIWSCDIFEGYGSILVHALLFYY